MVHRKTTCISKNGLKLLVVNATFKNLLSLVFKTDSQHKACKIFSCIV